MFFRIARWTTSRCWSIAVVSLAVGYFALSLKLSKVGGDACPDGRLLVAAGIVKDRYDMKFGLEIEKTPLPETLAVVSVDPIDEKLNAPVTSDIVAKFGEPICESSPDGDSSRCPVPYPLLRTATRPRAARLAQRYGRRFFPNIQRSLS